ncbi:MAG: TlpA family protein disulfide reductase [Candidatus Marinimicrobia bacterium]|nr:TlpA family protein disulfide reductase [Candidatus Neomarinimicrobiota bacterium]
MKRKMFLALLIVAIGSLNFCTKEPEISPERFKVLADTVATELDYEPWMDFGYELSKNYPEEYVAGMILVQSAERAIMEQDAKRFDKIFDLLKNYPENGSLEMTDQIVFGNRIVLIMAEQMLLFDKAPEVMDFTIKKFREKEVGLQWRNEIGAMIFDTQGNLHEKMDETDKAIEAFGVSLDYFEQPQTLLSRGLILESQNDLEGALEDYIAAMGISPNQPMLVQKVKEVYTKLNPSENAETFIVEIQVSLQERRKEEVLSESFFNDAPAFEMTDFNQRLINNKTMLGKVVFVDFWATWCNPCRRELPEFQKFYDLYKNNPRVVFVAASTDAEKEKVLPYIQEMNYTFPVAYAADTATKFGVEGIPSLFIIGPSGKIRYKIVGFDPDKDFVREMSWRLESLLDS